MAVRNGTYISPTVRSDILILLDLMEGSGKFQEIKRAVNGYIQEIKKAHFDQRFDKSVKTHLQEYLTFMITESEFRMRPSVVTMGQGRNPLEEFQLRVRHLKKVFSTHSDEQIQKDWYN